MSSCTGWLLDISKRKFPIWKGSSCKVALSYIILLSFLPMSIIAFVESEQLGVDTSALHDYVRAAQPRPSPFPSSWHEHDMWLKGETSSTRAEWLASQRSVFVQATLPSVQWGEYSATTLWLLGIYAQSYKDSIDEVISDLLKRRKFWSLVVFVALTFFVSVLLTAALDGIIVRVYHVFEQHVQNWLDGSVVYTGPCDKDLCLHSRQIKHPFANGTDVPLFLKHVYRYDKEDAVLNCHYTVWALTNATPISSAFGWKKDGEPINVSDRLTVHTSIDAVGVHPLIDAIQLYVVDSNLTIFMVDDTDYASYSCTRSPVIFMWLDPAQEEKREPLSKSERQRDNGPTMVPNEKCGCRPADKADERKQRVKTDVCMAEFKLKKRIPKETLLPVQINPGGVLIDEFHYVTEAHHEDITLDITDFSSSRHGQSRSCCSPSSAFYWIFFKGGGFVVFPFIRIVLDTEQRALLAATWTCMCHDSYGIKQFTFGRAYLNKTTAKRDVMNITFPVQLQLHPANYTTVPLLDNMPACSSRTEDLSTFCYCLQAVLENSYYTAYTHDVFFLLVIPALFLVAYFMYRAIFWVKRVFMLPLRRIFLTVDESEPFSDTNGTDTDAEAQRSTEEEHEARPSYDIFLTYDSEGERDYEVANFLKGMFSSWGFQVFDSNTSVAPGHIAINKISKAITKSARFVMISSPECMEDPDKKLEVKLIRHRIITRNLSIRNPVLLVETVRPRAPSLYLGSHSASSVVYRDSSRTDTEMTHRRLQRWATAELPLNEKPVRPDISVVTSCIRMVLAFLCLLCFAALSKFNVFLA